MTINSLAKCYNLYMGVSKNRGTPKWMVKIMENPIKMDDFGVPLFMETPIFSMNHEFVGLLPSTNLPQC